MKNVHIWSTDKIYHYNMNVSTITKKSCQWARNDIFSMCLVTLGSLYKKLNVQSQSKIAYLSKAKECNQVHLFEYCALLQFWSTCTSIFLLR